MRNVLTLLTMFALAGCAGIPGPASVQTGEAQNAVRAQLGAPATERKLVSGESAWYYVTGPSGYFTWRVVFGRDGRVTEYAQVLNMKNFLALQEGATRDAVLDLLGPPMQRMTFAGTGTEVWTYRWIDGTFQMITDATFGAGAGAFKQASMFLDPAYNGADYE
jgi:hypothetical protein